MSIKPFLYWGREPADFTRVREGVFGEVYVEISHSAKAWVIARHTVGALFAFSAPFQCHDIEATMGRLVVSS